jgi:plastocyanin
MLIARARWMVLISTLALVSVGCGSDDEVGTTPTSATGGTETGGTATGGTATGSTGGTTGTTGSASDCTESNATDLTGDDPYTLTVKNFQFKPDCFMADFAAASIAIENKDDVAHTFTIDGTLVNAPLSPHSTYRHGPGGGDFLDPGPHPFHCSIHPEMTGTMIVV